MIKKLFVDGFKSLKKFEIDFTKGLNVIIGPNGVGKTNICQALTILASLPNNTIKDILNQLGGASSILQPKRLKVRSMVTLIMASSTLQQTTMTTRLVIHVRQQHSVNLQEAKR